MPGLPREDTLHSLAYRLLLIILVPLLLMLAVLAVYRVWKRIRARAAQHTAQFPKVYPNLHSYRSLLYHPRSMSVGHISPGAHANVPFYAKSSQKPPIRRHSCGWYASTDPLDAVGWAPISAPALSMEELYVQPAAHLFFGHPRRTPPSIHRQSTLSPIKELNAGEGVECPQTSWVEAESQSVRRGSSADRGVWKHDKRPPEPVVIPQTAVEKSAAHNASVLTDLSHLIKVHLTLVYSSTSQELLVTLNRINRLVLRPPTKEQILFCIVRSAGTIAELKVMLKHALLWCVFIECVVCKPDVLHLKTYDADVYASSTDVGSDPRYAIDHDFNASTPTCFLSSANRSDASGFHWLIMDLGAITLGITEIRLTLGPEENAFGVEDIDIFTAVHLYTSHIYQTNRSARAVSLPWDAYEFCNSTSNEFLTPNGAVVLCSPAKSGRWIILRRKTKPLYLCLLAVYVESTSHECFEEVAVGADGVADVSPGNVFRLERHVTHGQCRESCMETPVCQAIAFAHRRRTGMCYLLQQFNRTDDSSASPFSCVPGRKCKIEENICHRGHVLPLVHLEGENNRKWTIQVPSTLPDYALEIGNLYAVQMRGKAVCRSSKCDLLEISVIDEYGESHTCKRLDLSVISVLDKLPAYCERPDNQSKVSLVVLQLIPGEGDDSTGSNTDLKVEGGYVQLLDNTRPAALIREMPTIPKILERQGDDFENETENYEEEAISETFPSTEATTASELPSTSTVAPLLPTTSPTFNYNVIEENTAFDPVGFWVELEAINSTFTTAESETTDTAAIDKTSEPVSIAGFQFDYFKILIAICVGGLLLILLAALIIWACCRRSKKRSVSK
ncbi:hypothetical protein AAHC03_017143 [Spirometra sp. Aus1]